VGVGDGEAVGDGDGALDGGVLPRPATRPEPVGGPLGPAVSAASAPRATPPTMARAASAATTVRFIGRALRACG
jgi:hypothetical protein